VSKSKPAATHLFRADPTTPGDPVTGKQVCAHCHLLGQAGDAHHTLPAAEPDAQTRAAGDN
jgi:hypothetical protein